MASSRLKHTRDGRSFYEIRVSNGRGKPEYTERWYVPDGLSKKTIERELHKAEANFENRCKNGEVMTRAEIKAAEDERKREESRIQTVRQYGEHVFMPDLTITGSEHTRDNFQRALNLHIYPILGEIKMPDVTPEQITALLLSMQAPKAVENKKPLGYSR